MGIFTKLYYIWHILSGTIELSKKNTSRISQLQKKYYKTSKQEKQIPNVLKSDRSTVTKNWHRGSVQCLTVTTLCCDTTIELWSSSSERYHTLNLKVPYYEFIWIKLRTFWDFRLLAAILTNFHPSSIFKLCAYLSNVCVLSPTGYIITIVINIKQIPF